MQWLGQADWKALVFIGVVKTFLCGCSCSLMGNTGCRSEWLYCSIVNIMRTCCMLPPPHSKWTVMLRWKLLSGYLSLERPRLTRTHLICYLCSRDFFFSFISLFVNLFIEVFIHLSPRRRVKLKTTSLCPLIQEVIVIVAHPSQQAGHYFWISEFIFISFKFFFLNQFPEMLSASYSTRTI